MRYSTHHELREQAAAFALGALGDEDRTEFEAHLLVCDECDDDVRSFTRVATALAYSVPPAVPDESLRARVVDAAVRMPSSSTASTLAPWLLAAACLAAAVGFGAYASTLRRNPLVAPSVIVVLTAEDLVRVDLAGQPATPRA